MSSKKYQIPDQRSIRQEKAVFEFVSDVCKYEHNAVYYLGASVLWGSFGVNGLLPAEITEKYSQFFQSDDQSLLPRSTVENFRNLISRRLQEMQDEVEPKKEEKIIHVYNKITRSEEDIPEHLYHPKMHERL